MKKTLALVLALLLTITTFVTVSTAQALDEGEAATPGPENKVLRLSTFEPSTLDPQLTYDGWELDNVLLEGLIRVHEGKIIPGIAKNWDISEDGLTYTFNLKKSRWSDGKLVTAHDFEYSILRLLNPATAAPYAYWGYIIQNGMEYNTGSITDVSLVGVKALDDSTLEIKLNNPADYFLTLLGKTPFMPSRKDVVEANGELYGTAPDKMAFNGPFLIKEWINGEGMTLARNYRCISKNKVQLKGIIYKFTYDVNQAADWFDNNEIDVLRFGSGIADRYKDSEAVKSIHTSTALYFDINTKGKSEESGKFLSNASFRKALGFAIDRKNICETTYKDVMAPLTRLVPGAISGLEDKYVLEKPYELYSTNANIDKAKELLAAALKELNAAASDIPTIEILTFDSAYLSPITDSVKQMLFDNLGINIQVVAVPFPEKMQLISEGKFDITLSGWGADYDDPMSFLEIYEIGSYYNPTGWSNEEYDSLIKASKASNNEALRIENMFTAEKILLEAVPMIPLFNEGYKYITKENVYNMQYEDLTGMPDYIYVNIK
ncbi:MAG: peptide ABC transporter substrate-binding protein [Bacillota bacterium]